MPVPLTGISIWRRIVPLSLPKQMEVPDGTATMNRKRVPTILIQAFSPHMVGIKDFHVELDVMPMTEFETLLKKGEVEACFGIPEYLVSLAKFFQVAQIPEHSLKYLQLTEESRVVWVTRDPELKEYTFTRVKIFKRASPVQYDLKLA